MKGHYFDPDIALKLLKYSLDVTRWLRHGSPKRGFTKPFSRGRLGAEQREEKQRFLAWKRQRKFY